MARYLIDANLPRWFSLWAGGDCEFVHDLGADWSDSKIWDYAAANGLTIVSKDADFSDRALIAMMRDLESFTCVSATSGLSSCIGI